MDASRASLCLAIACLPLLSAGQNPRYSYSVFPCKIIGAYRSGQFPHVFQDDGSCMGGCNWPDTEDGAFRKRSFVSSPSGFIQLERVFGPSGSASSVVDASGSGTYLGYDNGRAPITYEGLTKVWTWKDGAHTVLPSPDGFYGEPEGIADNGDVAGWRYDGPSYRAVAWLNGQYTELDSGGLPSLCRGMDAQGNMYGNVENSGGSGIVPVRWKDGVRSVVSELAGYQRAEFQAVSRGGVVAGVVYDPSIGQYARMFTMKDGVVRVMPEEPYNPAALYVMQVNDRGTILADNHYLDGEQMALYIDGKHYFWPQLYTQVGDYRPYWPTALNNNDELIGNATRVDNAYETVYYNFIAKPVPEPAAVGLGLIAIAFRRRRR